MVRSTQTWQRQKKDCNRIEIEGKWIIDGVDVKRASVLIILFIILNAGPVAGETITTSSAYPGKPLVIGFSTTSLDVLKEENRKWLNSYLDFWNLMGQELRRPYTIEAMPFEEIMKALQERTIDVTATPILVTVEREGRFDLSAPLGGARLGVATRYEGWSYPWFSAIRIFFSWSIFKVILVLILALVVLGSIIWFIEKNGIRNILDKAGEGGSGPASTGPGLPLPQGYVSE